MLAKDQIDWNWVFGPNRQLPIPVMVDRIHQYEARTEARAVAGTALTESAARFVRQPNLSSELKRWRDLLSGKTLGRVIAEKTRRLLVELRETSPAEFKRQGLDMLDLRPRSGSVRHTSTKSVSGLAPERLADYLRSGYLAPGEATLVETAPEVKRLPEMDDRQLSIYLHTGKVPGQY